MLQFRVILMVLLSFGWITMTHSAHVLGIFIIPARNHFNFHEAIMRSLLAAGHEVTVVAPFTSQITHKNFTGINFRTASPKNFNTFWNEVFSKKMSYFEGLEKSLHLREKDCHRLLSMKEMKTIKHFDVMFMETLVMYECFIPLAKKRSAPVIGTISLRFTDLSDSAVGNTRIASFFPTILISDRKKTVFSDRLFNFMSEMWDKIVNIIVYRKTKEFFQKTFLDQDLYNSKISLLFTNDHTCIQERAILPNTINIGGIQVKSAVLSPITEVRPSTMIIRPQYLSKLIETKNKKIVYQSSCYLNIQCRILS